ncbi:MAG: hypothetical protein NT130_04370 [Candidatus Micrarchaeota archaeon]|nr:hypothetical protein [Candidatus Micrarchaeota archaeon]
MGKVAVIQPSGEATKVDDRKANVDTSDRIGKEIRKAKIIKEDRKELFASSAWKVEEIQDKKKEFQKQIDDLNTIKEKMDRNAIRDAVVDTAAVVVGIAGFLVHQPILMVGSLVIGGIAMADWFSSNPKASEADDKIKKLNVEVSILEEFERRKKENKRR